MTQPLNTKRIDQLTLATEPYSGLSLLPAAVPQGGGVYQTLGLTINGLRDGILPGGLLPVVNGGTGLAALTMHGVVLGEGANQLNVTAAMSDGQILVGQTGADPLPRAVSGDATLAATGTLTLASVVASSTSTKVTYDVKGRVTVGAQAQFSDIGGVATVAQGGTGTNGAARILSTSGSITVATTDALIVTNLGSAGAVTAQLPTVVSRSGLSLTVADFNGNGTMILTPDSGDAGGIQGFATYTNAPYGNVTLVPNVSLSGWFVA